MKDFIQLVKRVQLWSCRPFARACIFQPSEWGRITNLVDHPSHATLLQSECPVETALLPAVQGEWERCRYVVPPMHKVPLLSFHDLQRQDQHIEFLTSKVELLTGNALASIQVGSPALEVEAHML